MDGPSNLKRPRPDETRDEDLYFEDGSVILSAKDADGALVYFRIHKSVLERQSSVFKDMFSVPSPAETDLYDGLPLVHVHDYSKELKEFLQVMYDPGWVTFDPANCCSNWKNYSYLPFLRLHPDTPALIAGPLKLATKYQADSLRNRIVSHLNTDWPTTLCAWDDVAYAAVKPKPDSSEADEACSHSSLDESHRTIDFCPDPIPFISLARECDLPDIFATIFYSLCYDSETRSEKLSRMTRGDLEVLFLGKEHMMSFICGPASAGLGFWVNSGYDTDCRTQCYKFIILEWSDIVTNMMRGDPLGILRTHVLECRQFVKDHQDGLYRDYNYNGEPDDMCIACKESMADELENLRQKVFDDLPSFFPL